MKIKNEQWKVIKVNESYEVSDLGRIRHTYKNGKTKVLTPMSNCQFKNDYLFVMIDGKKYYIHNLVLETFIGMKPSGYECDHIDGKRQNNCLDNLRYLSQSENRSHKGVAHGMAKLTDKIVIAIRKMSGKGYLQKDLAELFEVSASTISSVITGKTWTHVA